MTETWEAFSERLSKGIIKVEKCSDTTNCDGFVINNRCSKCGKRDEKIEWKSADSIPAPARKLAVIIFDEPDI
jgi:hypothetical protein